MFYYVETINYVIETELTVDFLVWRLYVGIYKQGLVIPDIEMFPVNLTVVMNLLSEKESYNEYSFFID